MAKDKEPRFAHLLQPNRNLQANWDVDVAQELESYLAVLSSVSIPDEEGHDSFNFAEAALLIQGSIQIYSRKVEYLYSLVLQAVDFIDDKKQAQRVKSSIQANGKDADIIEDQEENFLNLDDVPEETNIDLVDKQKDSSSRKSAVKPPACLLVVEGENADISGDAGELALCQISTSSLHRDFLLLDPCDAKLVDEYWKENAMSKMARDSSDPSNKPRERNPSICGTPIQDQYENQDVGPSGMSQRVHTGQKTQGPPESFSFDNDADGGFDDDGGNDAWVDTLRRDAESNGGAAQEIDGNQGLQNSNQGHDRNEQEDEVPDPWAPLNPHELGTLPVVHYRRGRPNMKPKSRKPREFPLEPAVSESGRVWQALETLKREVWRSKQSEEPPPYEKLRSSFTVKRAPLPGAEWSFDRCDKDSDNEESISDCDEIGGSEEPDVYHPDVVDDYGSQDPSQQSNHGTEHIDSTDVERNLHEASNLEELCQAQWDAVLKRCGGSEKLLDLAKRVRSWNKKIEKNLAIQDGHPPFNIHAYGERILDRLSSEDHDQDNDHSTQSIAQKPFTEIVAGLEKHEVARTFAALLQLVNNGNVVLDKGNALDLPECFTAEHPFTVKLLSCRKPHEEMLHYRAPSSRQQNKSSARKKGKAVLLQDDEGDENLASSFNLGNGQTSLLPVSPRPFLAMGKSRRLSGGIGRFDIEREMVDSFNTTSPTPKAKSNTPEGKRRRRRQSLKSVQVRLAG